MIKGKECYFRNYYYLCSCELHINFTTLLLCLVFNKSTTHWKIVRRAFGEQSREGHLLNL